MDRDHVESASREVTGSVKEAIGKITGDTRLQAEGRTDKAQARAVHDAGRAADTSRGIVEE